MNTHVTSGFSLMRRAHLGALVVLGALMFLTVAPDAHSQSAAQHPRDVVARLNETLIGVMKIGGESGFEQRHALLDPILRDSLDLPFIADAILAAHADQAAAGELGDFVAAFSELVVSTYAARFTGFDGHTIDIASERDMRGGRKLVRTTLTEPDGATVSLDYLLQRTNDRWRIVNIVSGGVSDLSLRRAEYGAIISKEGLASLVKRMRVQEKALNK
jgi:phospholipid transport system substrate-binding protein